jgi:hypothetical protein
MGIARPKFAVCVYDTLLAERPETPPKKDARLTVAEAGMQRHATCSSVDSSPRA